MIKNLHLFLSFFLIIACSDSDNSAKNASSEGSASADSAHSESFKKTQSLLKKDWSELDSDFTSAMIRENNIPEATFEVKDRKCKDENSYSLTIRSYKGERQPKIIVNKGLYEIDEQGALISKKDNLPKKILFEEKDSSHIEIQWGSKSDEKMTLFKTPDSIQELCYKWVIKAQEGKQKCLSKDFTSWQTTDEYNSKYKPQPKDEAKDKKYLLEFSEEAKKNDYAPYGEWRDCFENYWAFIKKTALIENGDKKNRRAIRVFKNDAEEPLFYVLDYDKDKGIIKTLNAGTLNEKKEKDTVYHKLIWQKQQSKN